MSRQTANENTALATRIARRLRDARLEHGLTVREAARKLGLPDHTRIVRYETGTAQPAVGMLQALASLYGLTPAALLAEDDVLVPVIAALERAAPNVQLAVAELVGQ